MTYEESLQHLASLGPELRVSRSPDGATTAPRKFSLDHIRTLLHALGDPQHSFPSVLIAGTNGKGSTAATLASIAAAAGLRTGLYTSPHLLRVNERIRISSDNPADNTPALKGTGFSPYIDPAPTPRLQPLRDTAAANPAFPATPLAEIPDTDFAAVFSIVHTTATHLVESSDLPHYPSYFELLTAIALYFFAEQRIDLAVLEVGLGGRLDATNAVDPLISIVTDIGIDHTEYLGHTIREIATEKAGILRSDGVLVTLSQHPEANAAIGDVAMRLNVRGVDAVRCLPPRETLPSAPTHPSASPLARNRYDLSIEGQVLHVDSPLAGQHQQRNIALAIAAALELRTNHQHHGQPFAIPNAAIEQGIRSTSWPGRLEWLPSPHGHAPLLLDVAHNPAGAWTLRAALAQLPATTPRTLIFSCLADKQIDEMAQVLLPLFDSTSGDPDRALAHVNHLLAAAHRLDVPAHAAPHLAAALAQAHAITPPHGIIVATGSVFLVGEIRALALEEPR